MKGSLKFDRKEFRSGRCVVYDRVKGDDGQYKAIKIHLTPAHRGKLIPFNDAEYVLEKYPAFFPVSGTGKCKGCDREVTTEDVFRFKICKDCKKLPKEKWKTSKS